MDIQDEIENQSEESIKVNVILPILNSLGFDKLELSFENSFKIKLGRCSYLISTKEQFKPVLGEKNPRYDILVKRNGINCCIVEVKKGKITEEDIEQAIVYARLIHPIAPFCIVCNGKENPLFIDTITKEDIQQSDIKIDGYHPTLNEELYFESLKYFLGYSKENLLTFCNEQVKIYIEPLISRSKNKDAKYITELYEHNEMIDTEFRNFLKTEKKCFAVIGNSGIGKSCWICDTTISYGKRYPVLFYRSSNLHKDGILTSISDDLSWELSPTLSESQSMKRFLDIFKTDLVLIFIDGIDEIDFETMYIHLENFFLRLLSYNNVKLILTCKSTVWQKFLQDIHGVPSRLLNDIYLTDGKMGYKLTTIDDEQFKKIVLKYRKYYDFNGPIEDRVLNDSKRNLFLLKLMFIVASKNHLSSISYSSKEFYDEYYKVLKERFGNQHWIEDLIIKIALLCYQNNSDSLDLLEVKDKLKLSIQFEIPSRLYEINVLEKVERDNSTYIYFYYPNLRNYIISFYGKKYQNYSKEELIKEINKSIQNAFAMEVIILYCALTDKFEHKNITEDSNIFLQNYIDYYQKYIESNFRKIKFRFDPHTNLDIGIFAYYDTENNEIVSYGFRPVEDISNRILMIPKSKLQTEPNFAFAKGVRTLRLGTPLYKSKLQNIPQEIFCREIKPQLDEILDVGVLDESNNIELMKELVIAILIKYYPEHVLNSYSNRHTSTKYLPITIDKMYKIGLYERAHRELSSKAEANKRQKGEAIERRIGNTSTIEIKYLWKTGELEQINKQAWDLAISGQLIKTDVGTNIPESLYFYYLRRLKELNIHEITEPTVPDWDSNGPYVWDMWSPETRDKLVYKMYSMFLNEYKVLLESNFPSLCEYFYLYSHMPLICFIMPIRQEGHPNYKIYFCKGNKNNVILTTPGEITISANPWTLNYKDNKYNIIIEKSAFPHDSAGYNRIFDLDSDMCILRGVIYTTIKRELKYALEKFAKVNNINCEKQ